MRVYLQVIKDEVSVDLGITHHYFKIGDIISFTGKYPDYLIEIDGIEYHNTYCLIGYDKVKAFNSKSNWVKEWVVVDIDHCLEEGYFINVTISVNREKGLNNLGI